MERASGKDLKWFFDQWLTRSGVPSLGGSWTYDASAKQLVIELSQTQSADAYRLPIEIGIASAGSSPMRIEQIDLAQRGGRFTFPSDAEPAAVVLDPQTWVLMDHAALVKK